MNIDLRLGQGLCQLRRAAGVVVVPVGQEDIADLRPLQGLQNGGRVPAGVNYRRLAGLRRLGELEVDIQVLPGHMDVSTLEEERRHNPYLRQALRETT